MLPRDSTCSPHDLCPPVPDLVAESRRLRQATRATVQRARELTRQLVGCHLLQEQTGDRCAACPENPMVPAPAASNVQVPST